MTTRHWLLGVLWLALTAAIAVAALSLPWDQAVTSVRSARATWLVVAVVANFVILPLWAVEWRTLVPAAFRVGYRRMFEVVSVTAAVLNTVPWFAGEATAVALLVGRAGLTRGAALSVLAMDQLLVAWAKLAVLAVAAAYAPLPAWLRAGILSLGAGFALLLVLLVPLSRSTPARDVPRNSPTRLQRAITMLAAWGTHLDALREGSRLWRVASLALAKKAAELAAILAVQLAFGMDPSLASAALVLAALAVTTMVPVAPANLGVYEATVFAAYRYLGVPADAALGVAVVQHLCFLVPSVAAGYLLLTRRQLRWRDLRAS